MSWVNYSKTKKGVFMVFYFIIEKCYCNLINVYYLNEKIIFEIFILYNLF